MFSIITSDVPLVLTPLQAVHFFIIYKTNLLNIFFYLRNIFTKGSNNEYNRFFFERNNKIKRLCISLGYIFSSSQWISKISNSVIENYIDDKADLNFLILKYKYFSTVPYTSYVKSFYKINFPYKYLRVLHVRTLKYVLISLISILLTLVLAQLLIFFNVTTLNLKFFYKLVFFLWFYITVPTYFIIKIIFYLSPIYLYISIMSYLNIRIFKNKTFYYSQNSTKVWTGYKASIPKSLLNKHLTLFKKLLKIVNLLNGKTYNNTNLFKSNCHSLYTNLFNINILKNKNFNSLISKNFTWFDTLSSYYLDIQNTVQLQPVLITNEVQPNIFNNLSNNENWKNDRWLYKFSLLNTKVTSIFFKLSEQKSLINRVPFNEKPFNLNLWFKNIKNSNYNQNYLYNIGSYSKNELNYTKYDIDNIHHSSFNNYLHHLTYIEESLSFLYKRFFLFNSINSNMYKKGVTDSYQRYSNTLTINLDSPNLYLFKSTKRTTSPINLKSFKKGHYFINLSTDTNFMHHLWVLDDSFTYNSYLTNTLLINYKPVEKYLTIKHNNARKVWLNLTWDDYLYSRPKSKLEWTTRNLIKAEKEYYKKIIF